MNTTPQNTEKNNMKYFDSIGMEEAFLFDVLSDVDWIMNEKNVSRKELADRLDVTEARVSRIFSSNGHNLTLRTLFRIMNALDEQVEITSPTLRLLKRSAFIECTLPEFDSEESHRIDWASWVKIPENFCDKDGNLKRFSTVEDRSNYSAESLAA